MPRWRPSPSSYEPSKSRFAFFPSAGEHPTPDDLGLTFERATLSTSDGERLRGWLLPSSAAKALVVYFHGNGGNLSVWLPILAGLHRQGFTVAAIDYRGYGASTGRPSEQGLYRDVDAALEWATRIVKPGLPVVVLGPLARDDDGGVRGNETET